jgi:hypothetical protein
MIFAATTGGKRMLREFRKAYSPECVEQVYSGIRIAPVQTSSSMGDSEAGGEDGVALGAYSQALPGMQEKAVEAMTAVLDPRSKE